MLFSPFLHGRTDKVMERTLAFFIVNTIFNPPFFRRRKYRQGKKTRLMPFQGVWTIKVGLTIEVIKGD